MGAESDHGLVAGEAAGPTLGPMLLGPGGAGPIGREPRVAAPSGLGDRERGGSRDSGQRLADAGRLPLTHAVECGGEIAHEVEAIGNLDRLGCALRGRVRIRSGPVAADELDARMHAEPRRDSGRLAIGEKVDHAVALEIDQHRAVALAPAPGPVVDPEHTRSRGLS